MPIFFMLNGLGLVFLVYVLVNFWKEGNRTKSAAQHDPLEEHLPRSFEAIVVTHPISQAPQGGISVMPHRSPAPNTGEKSVPHLGVHQVVEMPLKAVSANSAPEASPRCAKIAGKEGPRC